MRHTIESIPLEESYERDRGSGSGSETGYFVEAKLDSPRCEQVGDQIFDNRWRRIHFEKCKIGVPACAPYREYLIKHDLLSYSAAEALRWWFIAVIEANNHGMALCWETRLVENRVTFSHKVEAVGQLK